MIKSIDEDATLEELKRVSVKLGEIWRSPLCKETREGIPSQTQCPKGPVSLTCSGKTLVTRT